MGTNYYRILSEEEMMNRRGYETEMMARRQLKKLIADEVALCDIYN